MDFSRPQEKVYFATKHGTLKKRDPVSYILTSGHVLNDELIKMTDDQFDSNGNPKIQIVIPRKNQVSGEKEILPSLNRKNTQFGKHNSFNLRLWS
jgi:hypothetical protein